MKQIKIESLVLFKVDSEPGDRTKYSYYTFKSFDKYKFVPCNSTFMFPQVISKWDAMKVEDTENEEEDIVKEIAERYNCNAYTVLECIRTIQELEKE
jgi:hypothetical protein